MIVQQLRKAGNSYVVTIPKEEVERHGWQEGQQLAVELTEIEQRPVLRPELKKILDREWERMEPALRYLADR
jgi:antitoxin component of MazEF toxin-antitoxin module